jgi:hypothetical protein
MHQSRGLGRDSSAAFPASVVRVLSYMACNGKACADWLLICLAVVSHTLASMFRPVLRASRAATRSLVTADGYLHKVGCLPLVRASIGISDYVSSSTHAVQTKIPMLHFQDSLPKLKIPPLAATLDSVCVSSYNVSNCIVQ